RPLWSIRASDAPALGLPSSGLPSAATTSTVAPTHQTPVRAFTFPSARNIVRSPLDIALAMQLRPGLGAGADPAWMVRFLMAMYGWLALVIAGG
ncbi:hypothetical protein BDZ97DRAFT_1609278, partial [Flammula alnicola]